MASTLESEEIQTVVRLCSNGIAERNAQLRESGRVDEATSRDLDNLLRSVKKTEQYAKNPPDSHQTFSQVVTAQSDQLKSLTQRLTERLTLAKAAYDD